VPLGGTPGSATAKAASLRLRYIRKLQLWLIFAAGKTEKCAWTRTCKKMKFRFPLWGQGLTMRLKIEEDFNGDRLSFAMLNAI
jgi:hypothetical protein